ncbi:hypothetical protein L1887_14561 [Cichorium endivia]|nr:hypothetical protein L1887_14561 [Cichorium endivia]
MSIIGDVASKSIAKDVASVRDLGKLEIETCICSFLLFEIRLSFSCSNFRLLGDAGTAGEGKDVAISGYWAFGNEAAGLILSNFLDDEQTQLSAVAVSTGFVRDLLPMLLLLLPTLLLKKLINGGGNFSVLPGLDMGFLDFIIFVL